MAPRSTQTADSNRQVCRFYQQHGRCRYGQSCKFVHVQAGRSEESHHPKADQEDWDLENSYNGWKRLLKIEPSALFESEVDRIWELCDTILQADNRNFKQKMVQDIVDEDNFKGFRHIQHLMSPTCKLTKPSLRRSVIHFLNFITHTELLSTLSIDTQVGDIYNFVSGSNGSRAIPFFKEVVDYARKNPESSSEKVPLLTLVKAIEETLVRNPRVLTNEKVSQLIENLTELFDATVSDHSSREYHICKRHIEDSRRMLDNYLGRVVDADSEEAISHAPVVSNYPRDIQYPGGRHDNDETDISSIQIVPTADEIRCDQPEYLPYTILNSPNLLSGAERLLDTHFRLYRHDIFGEVKLVVNNMLRACEERQKTGTSTIRSPDNLRAFYYHNAVISNMVFDNKKGLKLVLKFHQPNHLRKESKLSRQTWWQNSKRLDEGTLICLLVSTNSAWIPIFFTVIEKTTDMKAKDGLSLSDDFACVTVGFAFDGTKGHESPLSDTLKVYSDRRLQRGQAIIEFPGVIPATFVPTLQSLQQMSRISRLPFKEWIAPSTSDLATTSSMRPPLYARPASFAFNLSPICRDRKPFLLQPANFNKDEVMKHLQARTSLDYGQCEALLSSLTHEFALIQGPPGTGKSYLGVQLMRVLLEVKESAGLGPVIVVCYTNHALDQFLEHLLQIGIEKVIRVGGQSKSQELEGRNLRKITNERAKSKIESYTLAENFQNCHEESERASRYLRSLPTKRGNWKSLNYYIQGNYPGIASQWNRIDNEGFEAVDKREPFDSWRDGYRLPSVQTSNENLDSIKSLLQKAKANVYDIPLASRKRLVDYWLQCSQGDLIDKILSSNEEFTRASKRILSIHDEVDRRVLQKADVIGITTTGLAKRISVLKHVGAKVVLIEEAGEVIEAHLLSALVPTVEHVIQIGDQQQLRPQVNNFNLSMESTTGRHYQLDRSQFERIAVGEAGEGPRLPVPQLKVQRRMRPEISALIRATQYPRLIDHESVATLPDVVGMKKNIFWLDHHNQEEQKDHGSVKKSKSNDWETFFVHALVRHLVRQGEYSSDDIAVLTPYTGQLQKLRRVLGADFEVVLSDRDEDQLVKYGFIADSLDNKHGKSLAETHGPSIEKKSLNQLLRVATVDNFQGEEAKVVVISLVKSNAEKRVGFLRTENRINVLLSRAQHGMYIIGDSSTYENIPMWSQVLGMLRVSDSLGEALELCCPRHPNTPIACRNPDDFTKLAPEGGCQLQCDKRLDVCGHRCMAKCHSESMHRVFPCPQSCQRLHDPCGHGCPKRCSEPCGRCLTKIERVELPCAHIAQNVPCFKAQNPMSIDCKEKVFKTAPRCGHKILVSCDQDPTSEKFVCPEPCTKVLTCGHKCVGSCGNCRQVESKESSEIKHQKCGQICGRPFSTCTHMCTKYCHSGSDCGLCETRCEVQCGHSKCSRLCFEPCAPCIQPCTWQCDHHGKCNMPCSAPCSRLPCSKRCTEILPCGHQCPGLCGEDCPTEYCQQCCTAERKSLRVDLLEFRELKDIDLDESPLVALSCGHAYTVETLDGFMNMSDVYNMDSNGEFITPREANQNMVTTPPQCPDCKIPIRQFSTKRYNRYINQAVLDEMSRRFIVAGTSRMAELEKLLCDLESDLGKYRIKVLESKDQYKKEYHKLESTYRKLDEDIRKFSGQVTDSAQPGRKLYDATINAQRKTSTIEQKLSDLSISDSISFPPRDNRIVLGAQELYARSLQIYISHRFDAAQQQKLEMRDEDRCLVKALFETCHDLLIDAKTSKLPKISVKATLYYCNTAILLRSAKTEPVFEDLDDYTTAAVKIVDEALSICKESKFKGVDDHAVALEGLKKRLKAEWYEPVSAAELKAIKNAMVSGPRGIPTHSGHWYVCANGHPFAIGECGMPMELAICPECGAQIGGERHQTFAGTERAEFMEDPPPNARVQ